jgi:hypothetical protein
MNRLLHSKAKPPRNASSPTPARSGFLQRKCACGGTPGPTGECESCRRKKLQRQRGNLSAPLASGNHSSTNAPVPSIVHDVLRSSGQPLDRATRAFMEPRFGQDFSQVRVHTDARAAQSARAIDALAYTVGQNIVFGGGQYQPAMAAGRRLVAHELAHVVQQRQTRARTDSQSTVEMASPEDAAEREAESLGNRMADGPPARVDRSGGASLHAARPGAIQRTPAPPTYGGVTGIRDLSRISIDSVPDFVASALTSPRVINAHITAPSVVHMTWLLYNPLDNMMSGSFSTMPGNPTSITAPFSLEPSHFSGAGFVPGNHLLRCVGLNARHEPVVFADRNFNVLRADLTTGTALPTTYGQLTFTRYNKTDATPPSTRYSIDVELRFLPLATVTCSQVGFIQALQTVNAQGKSQQHTINVDHDARQTPLAWSVDRLVGGPTPFYGTEGTPGGAISVPADKGAFGTGGPTPTAAGLIDVPAWNQADTARFESCVICRSGANRGQVYGCATWGYTADTAGRVALMPRGFRQMPSDEFAEARAAWNTWRASVPAATRPEQAPALTSP